MLMISVFTKIICKINIVIIEILLFPQYLMKWTLRSKLHS